MRSATARRDPEKEKEEPSRPPSIRRVAPRRPPRWRWPLAVAASCLVLLFAATLLRRRACPPRDGNEDEREAEGLHGFHRPRAPEPLRPFRHAAERLGGPAGESRPSRDSGPAPQGERAVEGAPDASSRRRLSLRPAAAQREPPAAPEGGRGRRARERAGLAGGGGVDLPAEDQPPSDRGRGPHVHRRREGGAASYHAPRRACHEHSQHPFEGARLSLARSKRQE